MRIFCNIPESVERSRPEVENLANEVILEDLNCVIYSSSQFQNLSFEV